MKHYSEASLLETYYMQPGESMPVMMHLAGCSDCAARYERLEKKLRGATSCSTQEKPDTFWARQRASILQTISHRRRLPMPSFSTQRFAAAAALVFLLSSIVVYRTIAPHPARTGTPAVASSPQPPPSTTSSNAAAVASAPDEPALSHDPWQSEELREFHAVVEWESWMGDGPAPKGGAS